jgi:flagellin
MQVINSNIASLNAQRNLSTSGSQLATSLQRLSSGLRINSAKDDAAGLAISERFSTQIRGLNVATRNANDGISLAQTAEGAMAEIGNNLQRIRELAVQSSNATNSATDREALQKEVAQLQSEIQRVATQTEFNGTKLLDGSFTGQAFQVGANAGQLITVNEVTNAQTNQLGGTLFDTNSINLSTLGANSAVSISGFTITGSDGTAVVLGDISVAQQATAADTRDAVASAIVQAANGVAGQTGVYAELDPNTAGLVTFSSIKPAVDSNGDFSAIQIADGTWTGTAVTAPGDPTPSAAAPLPSYVSDISISTFLGAQAAIAITDSALTSINTARAEMGAIQNRFGSVIQNLQTSSENLSASRSRIRDADYAKETAELTRTQILQQAGTAMLAQANQLPQNVLSLLR